MRRQQKSNVKNQEEQELKILKTGPILSRLPITLAQLQAGNNSEKFKNEIRHIYYIFCITQKS